LEAVLGGECGSPISSFSFELSLFDALLNRGCNIVVQIKTTISKYRYLLAVEQRTRSKARNMASGFPGLWIVNISPYPI
jgi:hypothetical protein